MILQINASHVMQLWQIIKHIGMKERGVENIFLKKIFFDFFLYVKQTSLKEKNFDYCEHPLHSMWYKNAEKRMDSEKLTFWKYKQNNKQSKNFIFNGLETHPYINCPLLLKLLVF